MAKKRPSYLIFILGLLITVSPFSIDLYLPAFAQMAREFGTTGERVALSLSSYFIGLALGQVLYGPFLDRYGRKKPIYIGLALYIVASFLCMLSSTVEALIALRFLQAIGGCAASVGCTAMVRDFYSQKDSAKVFSNLMLLLSVSPMFAPTIGGFIAASFGWRAIFLSLAGIVVLTLAAVIFLLPEGHEPDPSVSLNPKAIVNEFISILKVRQFAVYCLSGSFSFAGLFVYLAGAPNLFLQTYHMSERMFGTVFAFLSIGMIGGGQFNILLSKRFSTQQIYKTALTLQVLAAAVLAAGASFGIYGLYAHIALFFWFISCVGLTSPNSASMCLAPFERNAGSAAALMGFINMSVGSLASAGFSVLPFQGGFAMGILFLVTAFAGLLIAIRGGLHDQPTRESSEVPHLI